VIATSLLCFKSKFKLIGYMCIVGAVYTIIFLKNKIDTTGDICAILKVLL
jgi:hypothetical protein